MNEDYVSYELAVALKAAGFDEPCDHYYAYDKKSKIKHLLISASPSEWDWNYAELPEFVHPECSAPLLFHAQKWLREKYHISIRVSYISYHKVWFADWLNLYSGEFDDTDATFATYEEALADGIAVALELTKIGK